MGYKKWKFDRYVASQEIVIYDKFGGNCAIKLSLDEVSKQRLSKILAIYTNQNKVKIEKSDAYIIPEYDSYQISGRNVKSRKLLQLVNEQSFVTMVNEAEIVIDRNADNDLQYYLKITQESARKYQCLMIVALLIDARLAKIHQDDGHIYLLLEYRQKLEKTSKIQSDLSHFRTLLGECNNMAALIELIEESKVENNKIVIEESQVKEEELHIEMMCLCDLGVAQLEKQKYVIGLEIASWLLEYISNTSDRISLANMYSE